jgi:hypothetical protein
MVNNGDTLNRGKNKMKLNTLKLGQTTVVKASKPNFHEEFDYEDYSGFLAKYELEGEVDLFGGDEGSYEKFKLHKGTAEKLAQSYKVFMDRTHAEKRFKQWVEAEQEAIQKLVSKVNSKIKVEVTEPEESQDNSYSSEIYLRLGSERKEYEPQGYYYKFDPAAQMDDALNSWDWARWLGDDESPFFDQDWVDAYMYDSASQWYEEAASFEGEDTQILDLAKEFNDEQVSASMADDFKKDSLKRYNEPEYSEWVGDIYDELEKLIDETRSDVQGIVDAKLQLLWKLWDKKLSAKQAAKEIDKASRRIE